MKQPLISIIIPVYNVKNFLRECLDSVIAQTLTDWEAILVDDGSTDGSGDICDEYAAADSRFRVIHKSNTGQADSRNVAILQARADIIGFVDSDDWIEPRMYEVLYNTMMENDADISICGYFFNYVNKERSFSDSGKTLILSGKEAMEEVVEDKRLHSYLWDKLFKKEMICEPLPSSYYYEDYSTLFKWFVNAEKVAWCQMPLYHYRQRKGSTDHDTDPLKRYHFFKAEQERMNYLKQHNLMTDKRRRMEVRVVKTGVKQIKELARLRKKDKSSMKYIKEIYKDILPMMPVRRSEFGLGRYYRIWVAQKNLDFYLKMVYAEKFLNYNKAFKQYYE